MGNVINTFSKIFHFELFRYPYRFISNESKDILINQSYYQFNKKIDDNNILVKLKILESNNNNIDEESGIFI